jgi:enoyl-CoA hydratase/carnithine racemase
MSSDAGSVRLSIENGVASVVFDRPQAHNAMTWAMYASLEAICERLVDDASVHVVTMRGAGGKAFVAGTDIEQFKAFAGAEDGVAYERRIDAGIERIVRLPMPVIAILEGWVVGGGLAIAAACDLRIATPEARFGVPIARTLGNCLSAANTARIVAGFGLGPARRMLLLAQTLSADEAEATGFVTQIAAPDALDAAVAAICERVKELAPLSLRAAKETLRRVMAEPSPANEDLVRLCYGSQDFHEGVSAFVEKRAPSWTGR